MNIILIFRLGDIDMELAFPTGIDLSTFETDYKQSCPWNIVNTTAERLLQPKENPTQVQLKFTLYMTRFVQSFTDWNVMA